MKKLLIALALVLVFALVGCEKVEKRTPEGWALYYAEQEYNKEYEGYGIFGYQIDNVIIAEDEVCDEDLTWRAYIITIINDSGKSMEYNVFIAYKERGYPPFFEFNTIPESNVIDFDIEKAD